MSEQLEIGGKNLAAWFGIIAQSGHEKFLDIRKHLMGSHHLDTATATEIAREYVEHLEKTAPSVWFQDMGRGGTVGYKGPEGAFNMEYEFGSGDTIAIIFIPSPPYWEAMTGIPLSLRASALNQVGRLVVERQTGGSGSYEIQDSFLLINR